MDKDLNASPRHANGTASAAAPAKAPRVSGAARLPRVLFRRWSSRRTCCGWEDVDAQSWYAIWGVFVTTIVMVLLTYKAWKVTQGMTQLVESTALRLMARMHPLAMCINGTVGPAATVASLQPLGMFCRDAPGGANASAPPPLFELKGATGENVSWDLQLLQALVQCGAAKGCYVGGQVPDFFGGDALVNTSEIERITGYSTASARGLSDALAAADGGALLQCSVAKLNMIGAELVSRGGGGGLETLYALPFDSGVTDAALVHALLTASAAGRYRGDPLRSAAAAGTWRLAANGGDAAVWVHLRQTAESAACLHATFPASPCGREPGKFNAKDLATSPKGPAELLLLPTTVHTYSCFNGVETNRASLQLLDVFTSLAKQTVTVPSFLGIPNQGLDDVYAIYTGILGSVFSAMAAWVAALFVTAIVWSARRARPLSAMLGRSGHGGNQGGGGAAEGEGDVARALRALGEQQYQLAQQLEALQAQRARSEHPAAPPAQPPAEQRIEERAGEAWRQAALGDAVV